MTEQEIRKYLRQIEEESSQTALRSFYNLCFDRFFRIAYYYLHTEEWAQEVVLDVFLKIWEHRESLHHIANLEDYFFITIKNASLNYLEKEQRRKDVTADAFDGHGRIRRIARRHTGQRGAFRPLCQGPRPPAGAMP